jgi:2-C-methyl-D-erythritol 4-phosphate cytidylyltransferase
LVGAGGPKAFVELAGRPMVEWSIEALRGAGSVGEIVVAAPPGAEHEHEFTGGDLFVVAGGEMRAESVRNGLERVETELVAIHDAARPLLTAELVEEVIAAIAADPGADGAIAAAPVSDTIKRAAPRSRSAFASLEGANAHLAVEETVDRAELWAAQTPQVFRVETLRRALEADPEAVAAATDEAMLVEAAGGRVLIHPAPAANIKVTTPLDLRVAELLLAERDG